MIFKQPIVGAISIMYDKDFQFVNKMQIDNMGGILWRLFNAYIRWKCGFSHKFLACIE